MANMRTDANRLANVIGDRLANGQRIFLKRRTRIAFNIANAAARLPLLVAEENLVLKSVTFVSDTGMAVNAASLSLQLQKHDGVGGAQSALSTLYNGTTTAVDADQKEVFAGITDADRLSAGEVLECTVTVNGAGTTLGHTMFDIEYEFND